jgi:hypothetical protein
MICAQVHTQCHKSCARYTLDARCLYFKRNAEKFGVRVIRKVRAIGRKIRYLLFSLPLQLSAVYVLVSRGFLITNKDAPLSVGLLWAGDQSVAETSTSTQQTSMPSVGFEPAIAAGKQP